MLDPEESAIEPFSVEVGWNILTHSYYPHDLLYTFASVLLLLFRDKSKILIPLR